MAETTVMDIYVKGKIVFSYVRGKDDFSLSDIKIDINNKKVGN